MAIVTSTQQREMREKMESRGLGDTIAKVTKKMRIKPCERCKKTQDWLNEKFPYTPRKKR